MNQAPPGYYPQPQPPPKKGMSTATIVLLVLVGLLVVGGGSCALCIGLAAVGANQQAKGPGGSGKDTGPLRKGNPIGVKAPDLAKEYHANEVRADEKYKGKDLLVGGYVEGIDKDFTDEIVVRLKGDSDFHWVMAHVRREDKGKAAALNKGQSTVLRCTGGGMVIGSPVLNDCGIAKK
jgi:hypothetical protein